MTIECSETVPSTRNLLLTSSSVNADSKELSVHEEFSPFQENSFSWNVYPPTSYGDFFKNCVDDKLIDSMGNWIYPKSIDLPPISKNSWKRINTLLSKPVTIQSKSLDILPQRKQKLVMEAFDKLEDFCRYNQVVNPIRYFKKTNTLAYELSVSAIEVLGTIYTYYSNIVDSSELHGGGVPYLLGKEYYTEAVQLLPLRKQPPQTIYNLLQEKPADYDIRLFFREATYETIEKVFNSILSLLAEKLLYYGGDNDQLKFIIQETAFESISHVVTEDKHFMQFSFGNNQNLQFDFTLIDKLANQQLFHCHGLSIDLLTFIYPDTEQQPIPHGTVAKGWKAIIDKLTRTVTVENNDYPYYKGWYRLLSYLCKGSWSPDPSLEPKLRSHILKAPGATFYKDLMQVSSQHTSHSDLSKVCALLTAASLTDGQLTNINHQSLWQAIDPKSKYFEPWLKYATSFIQEGDLSVHEVLDILQIVGALQCMVRTKGFISCQYYESSEESCLSIKFSNNQAILIPVDLKRALSRIGPLLRHGNREATRLIREVIRDFIRGVVKRNNRRKTIERSFRAELSEVAGLLGDVHSDESIFASTLMNLRGLGGYQGLNKITLKLTSIITEPLPQDIKQLLIGEYSNFLKKNGYMKSRSHLWNFTEEVINDHPLQKVLLGLLKDLLKSSNSTTFSHIYLLWMDIKQEISKAQMNIEAWLVYERAAQLGHERSVDLLLEITKDLRYITNKTVTSWGLEILRNIDNAPFEKLKNLTSRVILKTSSKPRNHHFNQEALAVFFNKLYTENQFKDYIGLYILATKKKILFIHSNELQKNLLYSLEAICSSHTTQMNRVIDAWGAINKLKLMNLVANTNDYQQMLATLIERSYLEGFDDFGDHLLFSFARKGDPLFSNILKNYIDHNKKFEKSSSLLNEVEKYSQHLTEAQLTTYTIHALERNVCKKNLTNSIHICFALLNRGVYDEEEIQKFTSSLNVILGVIVNEHHKHSEHLSFRLLTHENLHWYVNQNSINEILLKWVDQTRTTTIAIKTYEQLIQRIETLSEYQKFYLAESVVAYLSMLDRWKISDGQTKQILQRLFGKSLSKLLSILSSNDQHTQILLLFNSLSRLHIFSYYHPEGYEHIFTSFLTVNESYEHSKVSLDTCKYFNQQITYSSFYQSELLPDVMGSALNILSKQSDKTELVTLYQKCVQLLSKLQSDNIKNALISTLMSVQISVMDTGNIHCGVKLINILTSTSQIEKELAFEQLYKTLEYLDTNLHLGYINTILSQMSPLAKQSPYVDLFNTACTQLTRNVGRTIEKLNTAEIISFTEIAIKDNALLWCQFFTSNSKDLSKRILNLLLNRFYISMINDTIHGSESEVELCFQHLFPIIEEAPLPFINQFLNTPHNLSKRLSTYSEKQTSAFKNKLVFVLQEYIEKYDPNSEQLCQLLRVRSETLRTFFETEFPTEISEFDQQLIIWSCDKLTPPLYYLVSLLFKEYHERSLLNQIAPKRLADFFLNMPFLESFHGSTSDCIIEINHKMLNHFLPTIADNIKLQLKICLKIINIQDPSLYDHAAALCLAILNHPEKPPAAIKKVITEIVRYTNNKTTNECFSHPSLKKFLPHEDYHEIVCERICSLTRYALSTHDIPTREEVFEITLELLREIPAKSPHLKRAISNFWDLTISVYATSPNFPYSIDEIHQKVCFITIGQLFNKCVQNKFSLQLWNYSKHSFNKDTLAVKLFLEITEDLQTKLLNIPTHSTKLQHAVTSFVYQNVEKIIMYHHDQKTAYLPIFEKLVDYSLLITDETLFDFCVRSMQNAYRKALINNFFEADDSTLLQCIYFSELKDFINSPVQIRDRQYIVAKLIHNISQHPNHVNLRHGFTLLSSLGFILYSKHPNRLFSLYQKLLNQLPNYLYKDVHYVFYNKTNSLGDNETIGIIQQIMGSSPDLDTMKGKLKNAGAKLDVIPLFECVRQQIMPGDVVQFSQWEKSAQGYSLQLIDQFYRILLEAYTANNIPDDKPFDKYNTIWYLCDMLLKGMEFHGFNTNPEKYYEYALELIPYVRELLNDPRLNNRQGLYDVFEKLIFQKMKGTKGRQQLLVVHTWIMTLLKSDSSDEKIKGKQLLLKAKKLNLYEVNKDFYQEVERSCS